MSYRKYLMTRNEPPSELYKVTEVSTNLASLGTDCISRQAAIDALAKALNPHLVTFVRAKNAIEQLPTIQPKRGRWINGHCSECNEHAPYWCMASTYHASNFCPNCGADMREVSK